MREGYQVHQKSLKSQGTEFQSQQDDIDLRLRIITQSETSDEAAEKFKASMDKLWKLDVAAGYVELLRDVDGLRTECMAQLGKDDDAALVPYRRLQQLVTSLEPLYEAADQAAPFLLDHIKENVKELRNTIRNAFAKNLDTTLKKINWPKATGRIPLALEGEWQTNVGRLLDLQKQELEVREQMSERRQYQDDPPALLPFEVLVQPLEQRFDYHFSGNKPTNRLDKPEYFLNHITDLIAKYSDFVQDNLQPILLQHFGRSDLASTPAYIDSISAFITALLPMAQDKLRSVAQQLKSKPSFFSHLMQEVIRFDNIIKDSYSYTPSSPASLWSGLSYFLLDSCGHFPQWLSFERDFALTRYQTIIDSPDAGELDHNAVNAGVTKPSKAAVRLNDLLETITERYRHLSSYDQRMDFLMEIQIHIFDTFYRRLQSALESYTSMTSTLGRTMASATKEQLADVQGVRGLDRLCRIFGSADYLERAMRDWSDDVFYLELWDEMHNRSKSLDTAGDQIRRMSEIQRRTSSALGAESEGGLEGALFDETAASYHRLRARSENILLETLRYDIQQALRPYSAINTWASLSSSTSSSTSAELDPAIGVLNDYLAFLKSALGRAPLRSIGRHVCHTIDTYIWDKIVQGRQSFSTAGANQLATDIGAICNTLDRYIGAGQARIGMRKVSEGVQLLSLPVRGEIQRDQTSSTEKDDEDAAWEEETAGTGASSLDGHPVSLFQAERLVFMNNEGARHALDQLGLDMLSEQDARTILGKRVELQG